jgi:hypothetical protein
LEGAGQFPTHTKLYVVLFAPLSANPVLVWPLIPGVVLLV